MNTPNVNPAADKDIYKTSRLLYIIVAAVEYFISLLVSGAYLAKVTTAIGMSTALTGILTAFLSLGNGFQIIAIFLANKTPVKRWVTVLTITDQILFGLLYAVPFIKVSQTVKIVIFVVFLLVANILLSVVFSPKFNWYMAMVDDHKRGVFSANKEIISLIGGIIFTFVTGNIIDRFEAAGKTDHAFIFCGVGIFGLMIFNTIMLVLSKEKPVEKRTDKRSPIFSLLKDKAVFKVTLIFVLWNIAVYASTPFSGTYQTQELGFSMTFISVITAFGGIARAFFSRPFGKYADKTSFTDMLNICFVIAAAAFLINVFAVPSNGKVLFTVYYTLYCICLAGTNSGMTNIIYEYVSVENRMSAIALEYSISGFAGFFSTLAISPLVDHIQNNGNKLFGIGVYAQQVCSLLAFVIIVIILIYMNTVIKKLNAVKSET